MLYKNQKIISKLSKNTDITILRQDKGRGVTILVRKDYIQKCVSMLNTSQFQKLDTDPINSFKRKVQWTLQKTNKKKTKKSLDTSLKKLNIKIYAKQTSDRDCFLVHQKYINCSSSNNHNDWKNLR